jgi:hypothetical protein
MKRPLLQIASVILAGRHCHPLGLLLAGLLFVSVGSGGIASLSGDSLGTLGRKLHGSVKAHAPDGEESRRPGAAVERAPGPATDERREPGQRTVKA